MAGPSRCRRHCFLPLLGHDRNPERAFRGVLPERRPILQPEGQRASAAVPAPAGIGTQGLLLVQAAAPGRHKLCPWLLREVAEAEQGPGAAKWARRGAVLRPAAPGPRLGSCQLQGALPETRRRLVAVEALCGAEDLEGHQVKA